MYYVNKGNIILFNMFSPIIGLNTLKNTLHNMNNAVSTAMKLVSSHDMLKDLFQAAKRTEQKFSRHIR